MDDDRAPAGCEKIPADPLDPLCPDAEPPPPESRTAAPSESEQVTAKAIRYIKAKRGGDLAAILLVGSGVRGGLLPHSDMNFLVLVKGAESRHELVKILSRIVEIRYLGLASVEEQMKTSLRLPSTLRRARVLFDFDGEGSRFLEQGYGRFRQGMPPMTLHEKIRTRADAVHWLGKAEDHFQEPALARYLFSIYIDECITAFHRLRGFWPTLPADSLRFINQRDSVLADLLQQALTASDLAHQFEFGHRIAEHLFMEIPAPARID
jgi:predicted nucleotidyltransferase